ncbi:MAG TPA: hypothetical protein VLX29_01885 [Nitrospirota bacterium]|nr:hypothetical protein [Nitrospirota bacterium]
MRKALCSLATILVLCCVTTVSAQDKSESPLSIWIKSIQQKIARIVPKKSLNLATGVAGTRGTKEDSSAKLYWMGKKGDEHVTEEELLKFKVGVDQVGQGKREDSVKALEEFMKQYPDSALIPDAKKTLDLVKAEALAEKKGEIKADKK